MHRVTVEVARALLLAGAFAACGGASRAGNEDGDPAEGGSQQPGTGGARGGSSNGGTGTGAKPAGGATGSGGTKPSGGVANGGSTSGGSSTGGSIAGTSSGGTTSATGGGGANTGGASTGGAITGGTGGSSGACASYCSWAASCGGDPETTCRPSCDALYAMGGACRSSLDLLTQCVQANPNCTTAQTACSTQANNVVSACGNPACPFTNDGECDEPEGTGLCPEGTDVNDCVTSPPRCPFTNDGECDEPEGTDLCPEGSDVNDCSAGGTCVEGSVGNTCVWACDMECDEPRGTNLCALGTDSWDCARYP